MKKVHTWGAHLPLEKVDIVDLASLHHFRPLILCQSWGLVQDHPVQQTVLSKRKTERQMKLGVGSPDSVPIYSYIMNM